MRGPRLCFYVALRPRKRDGLLGTGTEMAGRGRKSHVKARPRTPPARTEKTGETAWTAARTMEVLRRCPLTIAQRLVHCATAVSTAVLSGGQSHNGTMSVGGTAVGRRNELGQLEAGRKRSPATLSAQLHLPPLLRSLDLLISPGPWVRAKARLF